MKNKLTHVSSDGQAKMVDIGDKPDSTRIAVAEGFVYMNEETLQLIMDNSLKKGDVIGTARIAGIMGAKKTSELIPLCHPLMVSKIDVTIEPIQDKSALYITSTVKTSGKTGVEMEALTAVSVTALTVYDMAKAVDRTMRIGDIRLLEKTGGVHGDYQADDIPSEGN